MGTKVLKIGGSVLGTSKDLAKNLDIIGKNIGEYILKSDKCAIVVSALKGRTRQLDKNCEKLGISGEASAFAVSAGEIESAGLLSGYLNKIGMPAQALLPWNIVITKVVKGDFRNAEIEKINIQPILECFHNSIIPVIPGYLGATVNGQPSTLAYDGSDISAVAIAAAINADNCVLFKDVPGIYGEDGIYEFDGKLYYSNLSYFRMKQISKNGGNVLHEKAVDMARKNNLPLWISKIGHSSKGTYIR
ncbi:MAG: hypothetical protein FWE50_03655 [Alphaproteobacteria bacterium]|nr:hypothetical protein [Alphaproteobacteria bacterium]